MAIKKKVSKAKSSIFTPMTAANYYKSTRVKANSNTNGIGYGGEKPSTKKTTKRK
jgi:hypothetical protein